MTEDGPPPGSIAVISGNGGSWERASEMASAPFRAARGAHEAIAEGPLSLAWRSSPTRHVEVSDGLVCLFEGALYDGGDQWSVESQSHPAEAVASGFRLEGEAIFTSLRGDFWTLLWDRHANRGVAACDQMGGRCPYWATSADEILVAGELVDLLAALPRHPGPDPVSMSHWLASTEAPPGSSLFAGVHRLEAGHVLELGPRRTVARRYWTPRYQRPRRGSADDLAHELASALDRSVRRRTAGASGVGVLLSGGLDSSAVAALAVRPGGAPAVATRAYSATFPDQPQVDETPWIDKVTESVHLPSTRIAVRGGSAVGGALRYLDAWGVPPTSPNLFFWAPLLQRAADDGMQVMLDGEGGDELFGLAPYLLADRMRRGRFLSGARLATRIPGRVRPLISARTWFILRRYGFKGAMPGAVHRLARSARGPRHYAPSWMREDTARLWLDTDATWRWKEIHGPRWWAYQVDSVTRGLGPALVYEQSRRRAALVGLEARHPLVDVDVVELALSFPPEVAFDPRFTRPTLRRAMAGLLPDAVRLRPDKSSFDAVFHASLAGPDLPIVRRILGARDAQIGAYVDLDEMRRKFVDRDPPTDAGSLQVWAIDVWRLLLAECWLQSQVDHSFLPRLSEQGGLVQPDYAIVSADPPKDRR